MTQAVAFGGHPCTRYISEAGHFGSLLDIVLNGQGTRGKLVQLKKLARAKTLAYTTRFADYLGTRRDRAPGPALTAPSARPATV